MNKPRRYLITGRYCPSSLRQRNLSLNQRKDRSIQSRQPVYIVRSRSTQSDHSDSSEKSGSSLSNCLLSTGRKNQSNLTVGCKHDRRSRVRFSSVERLLNYKSAILSDLAAQSDPPSLPPQKSLSKSFESFGSLGRLPVTSASVQVRHSTSKPDRCDESNEKDDRLSDKDDQLSEKCDQLSEKGYQSSEKDDQSDGGCCPPAEYASSLDHCSGPNNTYDKMRKKFKKHFACIDSKLKSHMMDVKSKATAVTEDHIDIDKTVHCVLSKYCPKDDCCHKVTASICRNSKPEPPVTCCPPKRLSRGCCSKNKKSKK